MSCHNHEKNSPLLDAYLDGELDLSASLALEEHLAVCPECRARMESRRVLRDAIREQIPAWTAPAGLEARLRARLRAEEPASAPGLLVRLKTLIEPLRRPWAFPALGIGSAVAALVLGGLFLSSRPSDPLLDEAVADHARSLLVEHLTDVASTDQHTVKPWFAGKLDYSPTVVDTAAEGYPLTGGRLDLLDRRPVAALVYHRRKHAINLFVWPTAETSLRGKLGKKNGFYTFGWSKGGMNYLAVSELAEAEFLDFVKLIQQRTEESPAPQALP